MCAVSEIRKYSNGKRAGGNVYRYLRDKIVIDTSDGKPCTEIMYNNIRYGLFEKCYTE